MSNTIYLDPSILSTQLADQSILCRRSAVQRALQILQALAGKRELLSEGRGTVWHSIDWLSEKLEVSRGHIYKIFRRLRRARWIVDMVVTDERGRERPGFCVALGARFGFASFRTASGHTPDSDRTATGQAPPSLEFKQSPSKFRPAMSEDHRQTRLSGPEFEAQEPQRERRKNGSLRRDPRIRRHAQRVDAYERERYQQHPRCTRPKRGTPEAVENSVEAITQAFERVQSSEPALSLEEIEERFRAVVELNWESATRKQETWDWWTGQAMWAPRSLDRVLGWLEDRRNWIYLARARGESPLPKRTDAGPEPEGPELSPMEQQAEYNRRHGVAAQTEPVVETEAEELPHEDTWRKWAPMHGKREAAQEISDVIERGDAPGLNRMMRDMLDEFSEGFLAVKEKSDAELRAENKRKLIYFRNTTPEQRDADAKAGRKPWEAK